MERMLGNQAQEEFCVRAGCSFLCFLVYKERLKGIFWVLNTSRLQSPDHTGPLAYPERSLQDQAALDNAADYLLLEWSYDRHLLCVPLMAAYFLENLERDGELQFRAPVSLISAVSKEESYYIVTDRWQKFTEEESISGTDDGKTIQIAYCDEFLMQWMWRQNKKV